MMNAAAFSKITRELSVVVLKREFLRSNTSSMSLCFHININPIRYIHDVLSLLQTMFNVHVSTVSTSQPNHPQTISFPQS